MHPPSRKNPHPLVRLLSLLRSRFLVLLRYSTIVPWGWCEVKNSRDLNVWWVLVGWHSLAKLNQYWMVKTPKVEWCNRCNEDEANGARARCHQFLLDFIPQSAGSYNVTLIVTSSRLGVAYSMDTAYVRVYPAISVSSVSPFDCWKLHCNRVTSYFLRP